MGKKLKVGVIYGGKSGEHEVSLKSGYAVMSNLDPEKYEIVPVAISKRGLWSLPSLKEALAQKKSADPSGVGAVIVKGAKKLDPIEPHRPFDVLFPAVHGSFCEDGTLQGLLEQANIPYVGSGVLGSAIALDKDVTKRLAKAAGIPVTPWVCVRLAQWKSGSAKFLGEIAENWELPVFVKPANTGSSIGVSKVKRPADLKTAIQNAFQYDTKVIIEKAVLGREIEFSALESLDSPDADVSIAGEIIPKGEFYSYEAKYIEADGARLEIPAKLKPDQLLEGQALCRRAFQALECEGMARIDFFLESKTGRWVLNEINTLPGFTQISMYPKLWESSGLGYSKLLDRLIQLAVRRHKSRSGLIR